MVDAPGGKDALEALAIRLGKMLDAATRVIFALDYPWTKIWGDDIKKKEHEVIVSPRSRYGQATLPAEVRVDSGVTLRARRKARAQRVLRLPLPPAALVGVTPRRRANEGRWRVSTSGPR